MHRRDFPLSAEAAQRRSAAAPRGRIDALVGERLKRLGIQPARECSDAVFLRRAYLDAIGTLPTEVEARTFLADATPERRRALVDQLLEREEFADYQAMRWCDILRVKSEFPINLWPNAVQAYYHWVRACMRSGMPYDRFARALLTASGSNFRVPPVNFYRAVQDRDPEELARSVALTFMGARAEKWPKGRLAGMAAFFAQIGFKRTDEWKEEILLFDPAARRGGAAPVFPDGTKPRPAPGRDPRAVFADWLIAPRNAWFARGVVNRVWYWLMGRGIVEEPDDIRPDNPPRNPALLAWLEHELVAARYDLKHIYRVILTSATYQQSSVPASRHRDAQVELACYPLRRLEAEVLIDALNQITGTSESYSSAVPEPFTFIPEGQRAVRLADGSITSPFLEMFGRPPRDTGLASERNNRPTAAQSLHLLNSSHVRGKIERGPAIAALLRSGSGLRGIVEQLYLRILSRFATEEERAVVEEHARDGKLTPRDAAFDVAWALVNSPEFLYRH